MHNTSIEIKIGDKQSENLKPLRYGRLKNFLKFLIPNQGYRSEASTTIAPEPNTRSLHWPVIILTITVIQVTVFNYDRVQTNKYKNDLSITEIERSLKGPATILLIFCPKYHYEFWRYVTYTLVHLGSGHIILNMIAQLCLGLTIETIYGPWRVLILYVFSVICAVIGMTMFDSTKCLAGASAGVFALFGAHIAAIIVNWKNIYSPCLQLCAYGTLGIIFILGSTSDQDNEISHISHIVGTITGCILGVILHKNVKRNFVFKLLRRGWKYFVLLIILIPITIFIIRALISESGNTNTSDISPFTTSEILNISKSIQLS